MAQNQLALMVVDPLEWRLGFFFAADGLAVDGVDEDHRSLADFF